MSYIKIDEDTYALEASPDPQAIVIKSELLAEIEEVDRQILVQESQPDEILMPNDSKALILNELNRRKIEIENTINELI